MLLGEGLNGGIVEALSADEWTPSLSICVKSQNKAQCSSDIGLLTWSAMSLLRQYLTRSRRAMKGWRSHWLTTGLCLGFELRSSSICLSPIAV